MTVGTKLVSARTLNMLGGTLVCVGYIISSRAEDIRLLLLSYGVIQGKIKTHDLKLHMFKNILHFLNVYTHLSAVEDPSLHLP